MKTKKLIEDLKEEIKRQYGYTKMQKLAQLQFAERLIKAIKEDSIKIYHKKFRTSPEYLFVEELNKILDEVLKWKN